jgi:outer membrane protein
MGIRRNFAWLFRSVAIGAAVLAVTAAAAADYPTKKKAPPAPAPVVVAPVAPGFFVKAGFLYAINQSSSKLYAGGVQIPGVGATFSDVATLGIESGYYVTPNVSVDVSAGVPMWVTDKTKGATAVGPLPSPPFPATFLPVPDGTLIAKVMPAFVPVTVLYHFTQFGAFQPYLGAGFAPVFALAHRDEFNTGVTVDPTIGLVLQAGADVMIDQHWGWSVDVKKLFADVTSHATGDNLALIGVPAAIAVPGEQKTNFQPWILSTGVTYRF